MFKLSDLESLLIELLTCNLPSRQHVFSNSILLPTQEQALWELSKSNNVESIVAHALIYAAYINIPKYWNEIHQATQNRIVAYLKEIDSISLHFSRKYIPVVALKNGGIARGIYPCPGCCPMGDIDLLVTKDHFRNAHDILLASGYKFKFRSPIVELDLEAAEVDGGAEYWKILPCGELFWLELQWRPVAGRWLRPEQEPSAEELITSSVAIPGTAVRLLSPEDNLLHITLHTAKHTYVRAPGFRLHLDVVRLVAAYPDFDWPLFVKRVLFFQIKTPVYFSLVIPKVLFKTPIPDWVLDRLEPPLWKKIIISSWLRNIGLLNPSVKKFSKPGYILFNALLYDDLQGLYRSIFPSEPFMRNRYGANSKISLLCAHVKRLLDLTFRRADT